MRRSPPPRASLAADCDSRSPSATRGRGQPVGDRGKQQGQAEKGQQHQRGAAAELVGAHRPAAADRGKRRDGGEGQRHAREQRQAAVAKGWSARAKTKGSTGRMQGLTIVSTPPR